MSKKNTVDENISIASFISQSSTVFAFSLSLPLSFVDHVQSTCCSFFVVLGDLPLSFSLVMLLDKSALRPEALTQKRHVATFLLNKKKLGSTHNDLVFVCETFRLPYMMRDSLIRSHLKSLFLCIANIVHLYAIHLQ